MNLGPAGGFNFLPPVIKNLIIINVLLFVATKWLLPSIAPYLMLYHWASPLFKPWQILTHQFMHADFAHLFFNMFTLWMIGSSIESRLGSQRFLIFYLTCGFGAALLHLLVFSWEHQAAIQWFQTLTENEQINTINQAIFAGSVPDILKPVLTPMLGASGAIFGVLFAFGYLFPNVQIMIYFLFPIRAKYFVAIMAVIALFAGLRNDPADNIAHFAHLGGMIFAYLLFKYWKIRSGGFNRWN